MTIDWTLLAPVVAAIAGVRIVLRSRRQLHAEEIERPHYFAAIGGVVCMVWSSLYFGVGNPLMAGFAIAAFLPEALVPERHYARFEAWLMPRLLSKKGRRRLEEFQAKQTMEREAEAEFTRRMQEPPELPPGRSQGNDP